VRLDTALPEGTGEIPVGLPGMAWAELPAWAAVRKAGEPG
jgi:hypothetical protein